MSLHYAASTTTAPIKVSTISRNPIDHTRSRSTDLYKQQHNYDPKLHPFDRAREYVRALNAVKLDRVFARPFLYSYDIHVDTINDIALYPHNLTDIISVDAAGDIIGYNISLKKAYFKIQQAHNGPIKAVRYTHSGTHFLTCSTDSTVKLYNVDNILSSYNNKQNIQYQQQWLGSGFFNSLDTYQNSQDADYSDTFATCGHNVSLWSIHRNEPIHSYSWGVDSINNIKFNRVEHNILCSSSSDRNVILYDIRSKLPIRKILMKMQTNDIIWNPQEAYIFSTANEDTNAYTFDMRNLSHALQIYEDHVSAVMSIDYSPTGRELVTGSYDKTIRFFNTMNGHSRDIYHTKRMQRIFVVRYTHDSKYVLSGSDDANVRLWKSHATDKLKPLHGKERIAENYRQQLKNKYAHIKQISSIARHRHIPKLIFKAQKLKHIARQSNKRKDDRVRAHTKPEKQAPYVSKKNTVVAQEDE